MKKLVLGFSAAALLASVAFANDPEATQVAAVDNSPAAFSKLDMDQDGRVSAIEAANDSSLAAAFIQADMDKDGYLSSAEFNSLNGGNSSSSSPTPAEQDMAPPADSAAPPQQ